MINNDKTLDIKLAIGITGASVLIALLVSIQYFLLGKTPSTAYAPGSIIIMLVSNLVVIPAAMYAATRHKDMVMASLAWIHVSMGFMVVSFSQIYSPYTATWSILILIATLFYAWRGFMLSSFSLILTGVAYILLRSDDIERRGYHLADYSLTSILTIFLTIFTAYMFVRVIQDSLRANRELIRTRKSESMQINRLNTLLNSISDAVMTLNRYGRITSQNAAAQAFFDTNESLIGRDIDQLISMHDYGNKPVPMRDLVIETKSSVTRDDLSVGQAGEVRHLSVQVSRIRGTFDDEEEYGVVVIIRDITKQKTLEEEKDEFISVTSHELRTPVAIAEGSLSNLSIMQEKGITGDKLQGAVDEAHNQVIYLAKMINDLSTLSRAERGVGDLIEPINVNELLHNLYNKYMPEAEAKSLRLDLDTETNLPPIRTSRLYLEEILQNFITNSIKYTKEGSVTFGANMETDTLMRFYVKDTGIGMSKTDVQHIFEKFYRSEDYRTRETGGTGLGLYVVKKLADKLETGIEVESRLNIGSTFSFLMDTEAIPFADATEDN